VVLTIIEALTPVFIALVMILLEVAVAIMDALLPAFQWLIDNIVGPVMSALATLISTLGEVMDALGFVDAGQAMIQLGLDIETAAENMAMLDTNYQNFLNSIENSKMGDVPGVKSQAEYDAMTSYYQQHGGGSTAIDADETRTGAQIFIETLFAVIGGMNAGETAEYGP